jgi:peptide deformylase
MALSIVHYNHPALRKKGIKINAFDEELARFSREMLEVMHEAEGIGLAAQQVGWPAQLAVVDLRGHSAEFTWELDGGRPPREILMPLVLVNPTVTVAPGTPETVYEEGCLSFPEIRGDVWRPDAISVRFQDEKGGWHVLKCDGLLARCILHEVDHLNGVLFIDRMEKKTRAGLDDAIKALARKTREEAPR